MSQKVTIKDISKMAGVNPSTVSRALRDHPDISDEVKKTIKDIAKALDYRPNKMASNLRSSSNPTIALIIPEVNMFFFPSVINGVTDAAAKAGYHVMVLQSNEQLERELENLQICIDNRVSGIVISLSCETEELTHIERAIDHGIPVVFFDKAPSNATFDIIKIDDEKAAYSAVSSLKEAGCGKIAGIFGHPAMSITIERERGYLNAVEDFGLVDVGTSHVHQVNDAYKSALDYAAQGIDGIFAMSDEVISGIVPALKSYGMAIPDDCRIMGISDGKLPFFFTEPIFFLHHDGCRAGELSVERLIMRMEGSKAPIQNQIHILDTPLMSNMKSDLLTEDFQQ
ncbi:LacI family DNA-binding transcriptional regulator [Cryomorphaceae bacterium 1068]|nr:LacI family DNA-binding transcriptional regulator [Cryomorphaceae bacterium 1068]